MSEALHPAGRAAARSSCGRGCSASPTTSRSRSCATLGADARPTLQTSCRIRAAGPAAAQAGADASGCGSWSPTCRRCPSASAAPSSCASSLASPTGRSRTALDCGEGAARQTVYEAALGAATPARRVARWSARGAASDLDGDRRRLRGRQVERAPERLRGCTDFKAAIEARRGDLRALCPPVPAAAAAGLLGGARLLLRGRRGRRGLGRGRGRGPRRRSRDRRRGVGGAAAVKGASIARRGQRSPPGGATSSGVIELPEPAAPSNGGRDARCRHRRPARRRRGGVAGGAARPRAGGGRGAMRRRAAASGPPDSGGERRARRAATASGAGTARRRPRQGAQVRPATPGKAPPGTERRPGGNGNGSSGGTGPPANSNAGGNGNGNGVPGGGSSAAPGQTGRRRGKPTRARAERPATAVAGRPATSNAGGNGKAASAAATRATAPGQTSTRAGDLERGRQRQEVRRIPPDSCGPRGVSAPNTRSNPPQPDGGTGGSR